MGRAYYVGLDALKWVVAKFKEVIQIVGSKQTDMGIPVYEWADFAHGPIAENQGLCVIKGYHFGMGGTASGGSPRLEHGGCILAVNWGGLILALSPRGWEQFDSSTNFYTEAAKVANGEDPQIHWIPFGWPGLPVYAKYGETNKELELFALQRDGGFVDVVSVSGSELDAVLNTGCELDADS